jgi:hypothetical protein
VLEVAEIIRLHGPAYVTRFADRILPSHRRALRDLEACRTSALGGHVHQCDHCGRQVYAFHSCRNRHCPKCHRDQTDRWLTAQRARLLPCAYYLLTFTLPDALRSLARSHQKTLYGLLMKSAAAALLTLARDPRYVGGRLGCLAVLHTWTRDLRYHPHVHLLVTAGGLSADGTAWVAPKYANYLVPVHPLSQIFRAKMCAVLHRAGLLDQVPSGVWSTPWVVHCQHAGRGQKVLDYLGRYIFRVAIANSSLERIEDGHVTFRYRDNRTQHVRRVTLSGIEFLQRFLQHVLPRGCMKVRYYGIWSPTCRRQLGQARAVLTAPLPAPTEPPSLTPTPSLAADPPLMRCPQCRTGILIRVGVLTPQRMRAP